MVRKNNTGGGKFPISVKWNGARHLTFCDATGRKVEIKMDKETMEIAGNDSPSVEEPEILEEIVVEELSIDGVCGVY